MGSDNPPPPAGRLKARNKAQLVRAFVVTCAVVLLLYLTSDIAELDDGIASATGPEPGPAFPPPAILKAKPAKGAAIDSGEKLPKRKHARQDSMPRRENREVVAGSHPVKRDSVGEGRQHREVIEKPLPVTPKPPVYHGLYDLSAVDIKARCRPAYSAGRVRRLRCHIPLALLLSLSPRCVCIPTPPRRK